MLKKQVELPSISCLFSISEAGLEVGAESVILQKDLL